MVLDNLLCLPRSGEEDVAHRVAQGVQLERALCWTRGAHLIWLEGLSGSLGEMGFGARRMYPGMYWCEELVVRVVTHVDELLCIGTGANLQKVKETLMNKSEVRGNTNRATS